MNSEDQPLVSIIIPLYNRISLVSETITSIKEQTYPHWEAIVVDDGSTDGSYELVAQFVAQDARIKLHKRNRHPKGASVCRNVGAEHATGRYLVFLDSDDLLAPFCLEQRVQAFAQCPDCDFIIFPMLLFHQHPNDLNVYYNIDKVGKDDFLRFLQFDAVWQTTGPIYTKEFFMKTGGFDELLPYRQDYEFHLRVLTHRPRYRKIMYAEPDCFLRKHDGPSISQGDARCVNKTPIKEGVYLKILRIMQEDTTYSWECYYFALDAMLLKIANERGRYQSNLLAALQSWKRYRRAKFLDSRSYQTGRCYLFLQYGLCRKNSFMSRGFNKLTHWLLPSSLTAPETTLSRVRR